MKGKMLWYSVVLTAAAGGQILAAVVFYDPGRSTSLINAGWGVLFLSAIFGWLPIWTFRRRGAVEGRSYIHTTVLVETGVYAIVRHPQYLAGVLICIALGLISPHWVVWVLGAIASGVYYKNTYDEEARNIEKFGVPYRAYQDKVPRMNFLAGIVRRLLN